MLYDVVAGDLATKMRAVIDAQMAGGAGVAFGVLPQVAALGLILVMLGSISKKLFVWKTGFWGKHGTDGWHYELLFVAMCLVIVTTGGGRLVLVP